MKSGSLVGWNGEWRDGSLTLYHSRSMFSHRSIVDVVIIPVPVLYPVFHTLSLDFKKRTMSPICLGY
jgi:hypothetical protein